jgi:hypothetical protein
LRQFWKLARQPGLEPEPFRLTAATDSFLANADGTFEASTNNVVVLNSLRGNQPADIVTDEASSPNLIVGNRCSRSVPGGLCGS